MKSIIIGAGTYGEVYLAYLKESNVEVIGFLDDNIHLWEQEVSGIKVLGGVDLLHSLKSTHDVDAVYCPLGNNKLRVKFLSMAKELGFQTPNFIHHSVTLSPSVTMGEGVYVLLGASIMPFVELKNYVMISMGASIAHHTMLTEGVFVSTGVNVGASISVEKNAYIGISATIMTGIKSLGENCMIGAGAVVIKDVPANAVMAGVPAKILKYKE